MKDALIMCLPGTMQRRTAEALVQQALDAAARASKGFSLHLCTQARPHIGDLLAGPLQAAISIPQVRICARLNRGCDSAHATDCIKMYIR